MNSVVSSLLSRNMIDRRSGYRRDMLCRFDALCQFDCCSREDIDAHVRYELACILNSTRENSPFYRDRIPGGITTDIASDILKSIPVLTKQDIQHYAQEMLVKGVECYEDATGGSSGQPTVFYTDLERKKAGEAATYWSNSLAGFEYGDRVAMLWGATRDSGGRETIDLLGKTIEQEGKTIDHRPFGEDHRREAGVGVSRLSPAGRRQKGEGGRSVVFGLKSIVARLRSHLRNWIENVRWYDAFDMGENRMNDFHKYMTRFAPHVLVGYAGSLYEYAVFLQKNKLTPTYPLKSMVSSAEVLTSASRKLISDIFQKPIFDRYGNREFGPIAAECSAHDGLHINEHDMVVEIDSPDPYEIPGEILVTYFRNKAIPFIRYNTGDVGVFARGECACGRKTRRLKTIAGRTSDSIRTRDGNIIHGEYFTHILYGVEGVRAFQFVQETLDSYVLRVECDPQTCHAVDERRRIAQMNADWWKNTIREKVGMDADVRVEFVDAIPLLPSGKRKFTMSLLNEMPEC
ncbi:MAG: hypothetical protein PHP44_07920 [Kiritimatiellae bacterium]|nr:hypothetical protein [Kiritimatiellia bacterium]